MLKRKNWQKKPGASGIALNRLASTSPFPLPESYLEFLAHSNGGEGPLSIQPGWLILDPAETVVETEICGTFHDFFPRQFVIGSNGAGEAIAMTKKGDGDVKIVYFDMSNSDTEESIIALASSFEDL